jgi:hypothetical protein
MSKREKAKKASFSSLMTQELSDARKHRSFGNKPAAWIQAPWFLIQIMGHPAGTAWPSVHALTL